jgi:hypothetical protein
MYYHDLINKIIINFKFKIKFMSMNNLKQKLEKKFKSVEIALVDLYLSVKIRKKEEVKFIYLKQNILIK